MGTSSSTTIQSVIGFLDEVLNPSAFEDFCPNGLQVPGRTEADAVVTGVSACAELFERAAAERAGLVLVHHGLFWNGPARALDAAGKRRLELLFENDLALAAYHLPLDAHLEHGNNALLAEAIGARVAGPFAGVGVVAELAEPIAPGELARRVAEAVGGREPLLVDGGPEAVRRVGILSGGGQSYLSDALLAGLDAYVTGEAAERNFHEAREGGIHFLAAGHHATEKLGIRRLGELLHERFGMRHTFVDVPNPI